LPWRSLAESPYVLVGEPERLAEQVRERQARIGLDWLIVPDSAIDRFAAEVMPLL
jgi:alkanesulfonate monooxygenase SsuD/methylene tetrahydromethanopterin reductase-like flavin-dependent oxidoreductase (luciferase family)